MLMGISAEELQLWETGEHRITSTQLVKLAKALDIAITELLVD